ncbi:hypothetical protein VKT23_004504 [Stygiomarasmius scandens]|uniref:Uncharacterized protein n=1 Tax=Marasmiellus scandens TaxID=2682957 RepID=A0ABR1JXG0_9AGAR
MNDDFPDSVLKSFQTGTRIWYWNTQGAVQYVTVVGSAMTPDVSSLFGLSVFAEDNPEQRTLILNIRDEYMRTPPPRTMPPSGEYIGLPLQMTPVAENPGTMIPNAVVAASSYGVAPLASQHASVYVGAGAVQPQTTSPAGNYEAALLYGSPYVSQSAPDFPQQASHTSHSQTTQQLAPGQSSYITPYSQSNQQESLPIHISASGLPLAYTSPYVVQAQAPPLGITTGGTGYVNPYTTPAPVPVHGSPYSAAPQHHMLPEQSYETEICGHEHHGYANHDQH